MWLCMYRGGKQVHTTCAYRGERTICNILLSSTPWVPGIELRLSGLAASTLSHFTNPTPYIYIFHFSYLCAIHKNNTCISVLPCVTPLTVGDEKLVCSPKRPILPFIWKILSLQVFYLSMNCSLSMSLWDFYYICCWYLDLFCDSKIQVIISRFLYFRLAPSPTNYAVNFGEGFMRW